MRLCVAVRGLLLWLVRGLLLRLVLRVKTRPLAGRATFLVLRLDGVKTRPLAGRAAFLVIVIFVALDGVVLFCRDVVFCRIVLLRLARALLVAMTIM